MGRFWKYVFECWWLMALILWLVASVVVFLGVEAAGLVFFCVEKVVSLFFGTPITPWFGHTSDLLQVAFIFNGICAPVEPYPICRAPR